MPSAKTLLCALLVLVALAFSILWIRAESNGRDEERRRPTAFDVCVGVVTDFLDTLGIGSFATTTTAYRLARRIDDRLVPGTLNVGHALPTVAQALIYIRVIRIDTTTLVVMIIMAVLGALLGSSVVVHWPRKQVRLVMGAALSMAALLMLASIAGALPKGGEETGLSGSRLVIGATVNFVLGGLMCAGVGLYAPCLILVSVLGMNPAAAFPIMMGSCAFLMLIGGAQFIRTRAYDRAATGGLALGGIPAVLVAALVVRSLPLGAIRWLVIVAATYTATTLIIAGLREPTGAPS